MTAKHVACYVLVRGELHNNFGKRFGARSCQKSMFVLIRLFFALVGYFNYFCFHFVSRRPRSAVLAQICELHALTFKRIPRKSSRIKVLSSEHIGAHNLYL